MPNIPVIPQYVARRDPKGTIASAGGAMTPDLSPIQRMAEEIGQRQAEMKRSEGYVAITNASSRMLAGTQEDMAAELQEGKAHGLAERVAAKFDKRADQESEQMPDHARKKFREQTAELRSRVYLRAKEREIDALGAHVKREHERGLQDDARAILIDPSSAEVTLARRLASIELLALPAEERALLAGVARATIAESAADAMINQNPQAFLQRLGDGSPEAVKGDPILGNLPPDKLALALKQARKADGLNLAQAAADDIMGKGMALDEAMRYAEKNYSGHDEQALKAELASRFNYLEAARKDREQETYGTALLEVEQRGKVTASTWAKLTDAHRAAILNRQQAEARQRRSEAEGKPVKTDWDTYLRLRELADTNPQEFARTDLRQFVDKIGPGQMEQLLDVRSKLTSTKPPRDAVTLTQQTSATLASLGIKSTEKKGKFLAYVQAEVDQATDAKGKPLTYEERQQIIDRAVLKGPDPDRVLPWGERYFFELSPGQRTRFKPNAPTDAPASEVDALNEALRAQGIPQTAENRLALYRRAMTKDAQ